MALQNLAKVLTARMHDHINRPIPEKSGIGLRSPHYQDILEQKPNIGFLEVHPENYFGHGIEIQILEQVADFYPLSFHGVGLSLGSYERVSKEHLHTLKRLIDRFKPIFISEHASWSMSGNAHMHDLLPLPYNKESLQSLCDNISATQDFLGRQIFVENPSTYLEFKNEMTEQAFMISAAENTGCKILLDINNIYVNSKNHNFDPFAYINKIPDHFIGEIHLAGHTIKKIDEREIRIDTHDSKVIDEVWKLYEHAVRTKGYFPTLIEWDAEIPELKVLLEEADKANIIYTETRDAA